MIAISRGLVFGILGLAAFFSILQWQQPVLAQANADPKSSVRVCVDVAGSKDSGDYDDLIVSLSTATIIPVPLFKEVRNRCDYILRLGRVETVGLNYNGGRNPGHSQVEFSVFRAGNEKAIMHYTAGVTWNVIWPPSESKKLMAIVAQRTLKAIEKDQRRPAKPSP
ncbi:MAG: hypothetical protein ACHP8B_12910 [Terriglobales bacterium]